jgi:hypothetical protein
MCIIDGKKGEGSNKEMILPPASLHNWQQTHRPHLPNSGLAPKSSISFSLFCDTPGVTDQIVRPKVLSFASYCIKGPPPTQITFCLPKVCPKQVAGFTIAATPSTNRGHTFKRLELALFVLCKEVVCLTLFPTHLTFDLVCWVNHNAHA